MANTPAREKFSAGSTDPVVNQVRDWIAARDAQDALTRKWQDAEHRLTIRIKPLGISLSKAIRGDLPEARSMRTLMRRIKAADRKLGREAEQIARAKPTSPSGALAKIEMALRIQPQFNCEEPCWELLQGGVEQLRRFLVASSRPRQKSRSCTKSSGKHA